MENAVKALIMVAGLIIGVLVIGLLVYLFRLGGNVSSNYEQSMSEGEIASFNAKFESYMTKMIVLDRNNLTSTSTYQNLFVQQSNNIDDIVSVINLAYDVNAKLKSNNSYDGISIQLKVGTKNYYMNAQVLYDYFEKTINTGSKRTKNFVFKTQNQVNNINSDVLKLNELIQSQYDGHPLNDSVLYDNGRFMERIYRYYFDCTSTEYTARGRLNKMVFELKDTKSSLSDAHYSSEDISNMGL